MPLDDVLPSGRYILHAQVDLIVCGLRQLLRFSQFCGFRVFACRPFPLNSLRRIGLPLL
jgi:hypothetical protein